MTVCRKPFFEVFYKGVGWAFKKEFTQAECISQSCLCARGLHSRAPLLGMPGSLAECDNAGSQARSETCWEAKEEWFYVMHKQQHGPASVQQLAELFAKGREGGITRDTLVWSSMLIEWTRLRELDSLLRLLEQPPPAPTDVIQLPSFPSTSATSSLQSSQQQRVRNPQFDSSMQGAFRCDPEQPIACLILALVMFPFSCLYVGIVAKQNAPSALTPKHASPCNQAAHDGVKKHSAIRSFLKSWLPQRSAPKDLVRRGILHMDPSGTVSGGPASAATTVVRDDSLFGGNLAVQIRRPDTINAVPAIVGELMHRLRQNEREGLRTEGIFRVPGDASEMRIMRAQLNEAGEIRRVVANCANLHSVAGMLKMYFRELNPPLLTFELYDDFIQCSANIGAPSPSAEISVLCELLQRLPPSHYAVLKHLIAFLAEVVTYAEESKMTTANTAAVFAPNLLRAEQEAIEHLANTVHVVNLVATLITCRARIFDPAWPGQEFDASVSSGDKTLDAESEQMQLSATLADTIQPIEQLSIHCDQSAADQPSRQWFYLDCEHAQHGPVSCCTLQTLLRDSHIMLETYVYSDGMADWKMLLEVQHLLDADP